MLSKEAIYVQNNSSVMQIEFILAADMKICAKENKTKWNNRKKEKIKLTADTLMICKAEVTVVQAFDKKKKNIKFAEAEKKLN